MINTTNLTFENVDRICIVFSAFNNILCEARFFLLLHVIDYPKQGSRLSSTTSIDLYPKGLRGVQRLQYFTKLSIYDVSKLLGQDAVSHRLKSKTF